MWSTFSVRRLFRRFKSESGMECEHLASFDQWEAVVTEFECIGQVDKVTCTSLGDVGVWLRAAVPVLELAKHQRTTQQCCSISSSSIFSTTSAVIGLDTLRYSLQVSLCALRPYPSPSRATLWGRTVDLTWQTMMSWRIFLQRTDGHHGGSCQSGIDAEISSSQDLHSS